jgi:hypothetical protein
LSGRGCSRVVWLTMAGLLALPILLAPTVLALPATAAFAHAGSGELMYVWWEPAEGRDVHGRFTAPADDAAMIAESLGLLRPGAMEAFLGGSEAGYPTDAERAALQEAAPLRAYLEDRVELTQDGVACESRTDIEDDFIADGARLSFTCPEPVTDAEVRITVLHDVDLGYQTFSGDGTLQDALHTADQPEHRWDFTAAAAAERSARFPVTLVIGLVLVVAVGVATVRLLRPADRESA